MVFWKDSVDFNRIIVKQQDRVDNRGSMGATLGSSPDRKRAVSKKLADEAIQQYKSSQMQASYQGNGAGRSTFNNDNRSTGIVGGNQN